MKDPLESGLPGVSLRRGDHICAFHLGRKEGHDLLESFVRAGLRAGDRCVAVVPPANATGILTHLPNGKELAEQLIVADPADADELLLPVPAEQSIEVAAEAGGGGDGGGGMHRRIVTDLAWVSDLLPDGRSLLAHESELDDLVGESSDIAVCLCDLEQVDPETALGMLVCHRQTLFGARSFTAPYYLPAPMRHRLQLDRGSRSDSLLAVSALMGATDDLSRIAALAARAVTSLGSMHADGLYVAQRWYAVAGPCTSPVVRDVVEARLRDLGVAGGPVSVPHEAWSWALPLMGRHRHLGYLVVGAEAEPPPDGQLLLRALAQQTASSLTNVRLRYRQRTLSSEITHLNATLADTNALLEWSTVVRERLNEGAVAGKGPAGIAEALHDITGFPVAVEDCDGGLQAWAGPDRHRPYPAGSPARRQKVLDRLRHTQRPVWDDGLLSTTADHAGQVVGMVTLVDPRGEAGEGEAIALEDAAMLVALELAHQRDLARTEARLGREVVEEILEGGTDESTLRRAKALGYDPGRPHRVIAVEPAPGARPSAGPFFHAVRRAARNTGLGTLVVRHDMTTIVLSTAEAADKASWDAFHAAIVAEPGGGPCRIGIGDTCNDPGDLPGSLRQAQLALKFQAAFGNAEQVVVFDRLGIYRMLAEIAESASVDRYVQEWLHPLEPLLDYDAANGSDLVPTLSHYLECGGRYDATAKALAIHRSTLKYRLQRIKDISGCDLADADTVFNLQLATRAWRTLVALGD
ncbi:MAG: helix-turn-helix domain-containing protein [Acidimicrobiales bacterium]